MLDGAEIERRKAICRECGDFRHRDGVILFCGKECHRPDGAYCEPWAQQQWAKRLLGEAGPCALWSKETMFTVISEQCAYGRVGLDGDLGYPSPETSDRVLLPDRVCYDRVISAHAPSEMVVEVHVPVALTGAANASFSGDPAVFWIDDHAIGSVTHACQQTPVIHLPPGRYRLRCLLTGLGHWKHTLWLVRSSPLSDSGRLALVTVGCYPEEDLANRLRWLFASAAAQGMLVHVVGVNESYGNHFTRKIEGLFHTLQSLPACYSHAVYLDGADSLVVAPETEFQEKLDALSGAVIGAESCAWPLDTPQWQNAFSAETDWRFPQAGSWGGRLDGRDGLLAALLAAQRLHYAAKNGRGPEWLFEDGHPVANLWDDQFCWQALVRSGFPGLVVDSCWQVFSHLTCTNLDPARTDRYAARAGRLLTGDGAKPCAIHFPGTGKRHMDLWGHFLGADHA